ncbi:MAG: hypothetical protein LBP40_05355 [Campylobacteraceae bacterium]|jgi:DNA integrity scanning protein DisA with diadenylate cyclase activity|nr:hypothetical protein [Campylobacteraceae bacterium]
MSAHLLGAIVIAAIVIVILIKQLNRVTNNIDDKTPLMENTKLYADFASIIQDKIRAIRIDMETPKYGAKFVLLDGVNTDESLEKLSELIRKLVFLETMIGMKSTPQNKETELFEILSALDEFIATSLVDGEKLADEIREEFAASYERLKNAYMIESM